jgi:hypothetical protein
MHYAESGPLGQGKSSAVSDDFSGLNHTVRIAYCGAPGDAINPSQRTPPSTSPMRRMSAMNTNIGSS